MTFQKQTNFLVTCTISYSNILQNFRLSRVMLLMQCVKFVYVRLSSIDKIHWWSFSNERRFSLKRTKVQRAITLVPAVVQRHTRPVRCDRRTVDCEAGTAHSTDKRIGTVGYMEHGVRPPTSVANDWNHLALCAPPAHAAFLTRYLLFLCLFFCN